MVNLTSLFVCEQRTTTEQLKEINDSVQESMVQTIRSLKVSTMLDDYIRFLVFDQFVHFVRTRDWFVWNGESIR